MTFDRGRDSAHEVYSNDLFKRDNIELHRFCNAKGVAYSAIYRGNYEEMSAPRESEEEMLQAFQRRLFAEKFGKRNMMM